MKGDAKLIDTLNSLLSDELTAINQYMVHAEMCENWGYDKLHDHFRKRSIDEMKHAEKLIGRILFLEGTPSSASCARCYRRRRARNVRRRPRSRWAPSRPTTRPSSRPARQGLRHPGDSRAYPQGRGPAHRRYRGAPGPDRANDASHLSLHPGRRVGMSAPREMRKSSRV